MREQLRSEIARAAADSEVRVIAITGAGRAFCAGADVATMAEMLERDDSAGFRRAVEAGAAVVREIRAAPQPVVACLNGVAAGAGASLAFACDLRIAAAAASLGATFNRIGLHPDWGATFFLPRLAGRGRAAELIFSGRLVPAAEAANIGLLDVLLENGGFQTASADYLGRMARAAPLALSAAKQSLSAGEASELEAALARETAAQMRCFASADVREGVAAFVEKRAAVFRGV